MTEYQRITGKLFGETATAIGDDPEIGQFGSAKAGTYNGTTDVATIQNLPAWSDGFINCVTPDKQYPPLPEMTGFGKVLSHEICYLLQRGVPEWDAATTYYENCFASSGDKIYVSVQDANLNHDPSTDDGTWWNEYIPDLSNYATIQLDNLDLAGNSKLQYAPFSINAGLMQNGENITLEGDYSTDTVWTQPTISDNGTLGGSTFAVSASSTYSSNYAWKAFDGSASTLWAAYAAGSTSLPASMIMYNPSPLKVSSIAITNYSQYNIAFTSGSIEASYDGSNWDTIVPSWTNSETGNNATWSINVSAQDYYSYYKLVINTQSTSAYRPQCVEIKLNATYQSVNVLKCNPCTVTTVDGRVKTFDSSVSLDCSTLTNGGYWVFRNVETGQLQAYKSFKVSQKDDSNFITPTLTQNGTLGGSDYAMAASTEYSGNSAYRAMAGNAVYWMSSTVPSWLTFYSPQAIKVEKISWKNNNSTPYNVSAFTFEGSNDNSSWTTLYTYSGTAGSANEYRTWNVNSTTEYNYHRISISSANNGHSFISDMKLTAKYASSTDVFVDTSTAPANITAYNTQTQAYETNNNLVYVGAVNVSGGVITKITNRPINACTYLEIRNHVPMFEALLPDIDSAVSISGYTTTTTNFSAPSDGYVAVHLKRSNGEAQFEVDGRIILAIDSNGTIESWSPFIPVKIGTHTMRCINGTSTVLAFEFYPLVGTSEAVAAKRYS